MTFLSFVTSAVRGQCFPQCELITHATREYFSQIKSVITALLNTLKRLLTCNVTIYCYNHDTVIYMYCTELCREERLSINFLEMDALLSFSSDIG